MGGSIIAFSIKATPTSYGLRIYKNCRLGGTNFGLPNYWSLNNMSSQGYPRISREKARKLIGRKNFDVLRRKLKWHIAA